MQRIAFLTLNDPGDYVMDDDLAEVPLRALGIAVDTVPWDRPGVVWTDYRMVVIRSTWDYHHRPDAFLAALAAIERLGVRLVNGLEVVRWNVPKTYLRDLAARGVPVVPTRFLDRLERGGLAKVWAALASDEVVLKPVVGANASGALRLDAAAVRTRAAEVEACFAAVPLLAQPLVRSVLTEGEYSLCWFGGDFSHAIVKRPRAGDFRVQEEHGGEIRGVTAEPALLAAGRAALAALDEVPLYARTDFVRAPHGSFWLMELELIEPSLYLRLCAEAPERFARAIAVRLAALAGSGS